MRDFQHFISARFWQIILLFILIAGSCHLSIGNAQFQRQRDTLLKLQLRYETGQDYVRGRPFALPSYWLEFKTGSVFFNGRPPFNYQLGLNLQDKYYQDSEMVGGIKLFYEQTIGRLLVDSPLAQQISPETFLGVQLQKSFFKEKFAARASYKKDIDRYNSHLGRLGSAGIKWRALYRPKDMTIYLSHDYYYGDKLYIRKWFGVRDNRIPNVNLSGSIFETRTQFKLIQNLKMRRDFEMIFEQRALRGVAKKSSIIISPKDNRFIIGYNFHW